MATFKVVFRKGKLKGWDRIPERLATLGIKYNQETDDYDVPAGDKAPLPEYINSILAEHGGVIEGSTADPGAAEKADDDKADNGSKA